MVAHQRSPPPDSVQIPPKGSPVTLEEIENATVKDDELPLVPWKNTFNMRPLTLGALALGKPLARSTQIALNKIRSRSVTSAAKSLDILRQNLQSNINKEIDVVIKKYLEKFFEPAVKNVRNNLGANSVSEDLVREVCRTMLEEAKQMYCAGFTTALHHSTTQLTETEIPLKTAEQVLRPRKRKGSDIKNDILLRKRCSPFIMKWEPLRVNRETQFILSTTAGKCLGLGSFRGRLCVKHPELVRYSLDQDDREWLATARVPGLSPSIPSTSLMFLEDIVELATTDEYRTSPNLVLSELKGFEIPDFIQRKVRAYMTLMRAKHLSENSELQMTVGVDSITSAMLPTSFLESGKMRSRFSVPHKYLDGDSPKCVERKICEKGTRTL